MAAHHRLLSRVSAQLSKHAIQHAIAFAWGLGEAIVFFVIPDVLVTRAALTSLRFGMATVAYALAGSLLGGALSYLWGASDLAGARHVLDALPAISIDMLDRAQQALAIDGMCAALLGSFTGVPYKVFAIHAAGAGIALPEFLLASIPVRATRFVLLAIVTRVLVRRVVPTWSEQRLRLAWALAWFVNYAIYWTIMPN